MAQGVSGSLFKRVLLDFGFILGTLLEAFFEDFHTVGASSAQGDLEVAFGSGVLGKICMILSIVKTQKIPHGTMII